MRQRTRRRLGDGLRGERGRGLRRSADGRAFGDRLTPSDEDRKFDNEGTKSASRQATQAMMNFAAASADLGPTSC